MYEYCEDYPCCGHTDLQRYRSCPKPKMDKIEEEFKEETDVEE